MVIINQWIFFLYMAWGPTADKHKLEKNWPFHYVRLNYKGREVKHKSSVWGITMSDKLDFMSEGVTAISRPFINFTYFFNIRPFHFNLLHRWFMFVEFKLFEFNVSWGMRQWKASDEMLTLSFEAFICLKYKLKRIWKF